MKKTPKLEMILGTTPEVGEVMARNMARAMLRVGGPKPRARARWLIEDFLATPPGELAPGEVMNRQHELGGLVQMAILAQPNPPETKLTFDTDLDTLRTAWGKVNDLVNDWVAGKPVDLPRVETTLDLHQDGADMRGRITHRTSGLVNNVLLAVAQLLASPKVRIRVCPECKKRFVPERRQERHLACARQARDLKRPDRGKRKKKGGRRG